MTADYWPFLTNRKGVRVPHDPVNVIFFGRGGRSDVESVLRNRIKYPWVPTFAAPLYGEIDDRLHGGSKDWKKADLNLRLGPFDRVSFHIRVYEAFVSDTHSRFGTWSLASVHTEVFLLRHVILDWIEGRNLLQQWLTGEPYVGAMRLRNVGNDGVFQGRFHDGNILEVELT